MNCKIKRPQTQHKPQMRSICDHLKAEMHPCEIAGRLFGMGNARIAHLLSAIQKNTAP